VSPENLCQNYQYLRMLINIQVQVNLHGTVGAKVHERVQDLVDLAGREILGRILASVNAPAYGY